MNGTDQCLETNCLSRIWKKIKKVTRGPRAAKMLCEHLQRWGIDARMIEEGGNRVSLDGQEIDVVKVRRFPGGGGYGPPIYTFYYGVQCNVEGIANQVKARMKIQTKGLLGREAIDFKWVGGEIADKLNGDIALKVQLLQQLKIDVRDSVEIVPDKKAGVVWITTSKYVSPFPKSATPYSIPEDIMPSPTNFRLYNAIAKHIRSTTSVA